MNPDDVHIAKTGGAQPEFIHLKNKFFSPGRYIGLTIVSVIYKFSDLHLNKASVSLGSESGGQ